MIVVFDTNIFVSAFAIPGSNAEKAIVKIIDGAAILLTSKEIIDELLMVMSRKFSRNKEELCRLAVNLAAISKMINVNAKVKALSDDPDNRILECAVDGGADFIVTGDKAMLSLKKFEQIRIITLKEFLQL